VANSSRQRGGQEGCGQRPHCCRRDL
jgi:hypothetical protein